MHISTNIIINVVITKQRKKLSQEQANKTKCLKFSPTVITVYSERQRAFIYLFKIKTVH